MTCPFSLHNEPKVDRFPYVDSISLIYITFYIINQIINDKKNLKKKSSDIISGDSAAYFEKSDKIGIFLFSICLG